MKNFTEGDVYTRRRRPRDISLPENPSELDFSNTLIPYVVSRGRDRFLTIEEGEIGARR